MWNGSGINVIDIDVDFTCEECGKDNEDVAGHLDGVYLTAWCRYCKHEYNKDNWGN